MMGWEAAKRDNFVDKGIQIRLNLKMGQKGNTLLNSCKNKYPIHPDILLISNKSGTKQTTIQTIMQIILNKMQCNLY